MIADYELMIDLARSLACCTGATGEPEEIPHVAATGGDRPGDDFNGRADWVADVLGPAGWVLVYTSRGLAYLRRPGKAHGISATAGVRSECGKDLLYVFSTNAGPLEDGKSYSKFGAYARLYFQGDYQAAAQDLAARGYGAPAIAFTHTPRNGHANGNGQAATPAAPPSEFWGHDELLDADLPPLRWIVEGLIPDESLTLLGGKKKLGKSWACLQIAQAVAGGGTFLGREVSQGSVIYLCLEDGRRRLRDRLLKQRAVKGLPIVYGTRFPKLDREGLGRLAELVEARRPRLLIIDTLAAAKTGRVEENAAGPMADLSNALRALAQEYVCGLLITHHHGKLTGGDPGDDLRGSSAVAAAADVNLGIYRQDGVYSLRGEGRDLEAINLGLTFDAHGSWTWIARDNSNDLAQAQADRDLLDALRQLGPTDTAGLAAYLNKGHSTVNDRLRKLVSAGRIIPELIRPPGAGRPTFLYRLKPETYDELGD
jgi:hypothetical protein